MRPGSIPALVFVLALLGAAVFAPVAGGATSTGSLQPAVRTQEAPDETPTTEFVIDIQPDGDARWRVATAFDLDGRNDTAAFRRLADRFEAGTTGTGYSVAPFRRAAAATSDASGREMSIIRVNRSARIVNGTNGTGYLVLQFTWVNFSRSVGDRIVVDDAFETRSGTWLPRLEPGQTLVIRPPAEYGILSAPKGPVNGTLRWTGPVSFDRDTIDITYERGAQTPTPTPPSEGLGPLAVALLVGLLALVVGGGAYLWVRRSGNGPGAPTGTEPSGEPGSEAEAEAEAEPPEEEPAAEGEEEPGAEGPEEEEVAEELLSDEERVERLLERNDGRMKQANIVDETGWSNAKVSQLLSSMEEEGRIEKLRIGRENLISFPGEMEDSEE